MRRAVPLALALLMLFSALPQTDAAGPMTVNFVAPAYAPVGTTVTMTGGVSLVRPLPGIIVALREDGQTVLTTVTGTDGAFSFPISRPARGVHEYVAVALEGAAESTSAPRVVSWAIPPSVVPSPSAAPWYEGRAYEMTWLPPADEGGAPSTSMRLYIANSELGPWTPKSNNTTRRAFIDGLVWDREYAFMVRETNAAGQSPEGAVMTLRTPLPVAPGAPAGLAAAFDEPYQAYLNILLTWDAPMSPGNGRLESYAVQRREGSGAWVDVGTTLASDRDMAMSAGWGRSYEARVRATSTAGVGVWSEPFPIMTPTREGIHVDLDQMELCEDWPTGLRCWGIWPGDTRTVYSGTSIEIHTLAQGDVYAASAPVVGANVSVLTTLSDGTTADTNTRTSTTSASGLFYANSPWFALASFATGECRTYSATTEATRGTDVGSDAITFSLCATGPPP